MVDVSRREFLFLRAGTKTQPATLSCEALYMRFLDSQLDGSTGRLFSQLADDLSRVDAIALTDRSWLTDVSFKGQLDVVLDHFQLRGGSIE